MKKTRLIFFIFSYSYTLFPLWDKEDLAQKIDKIIQVFPCAHVGIELYSLKNQECLYSSHAYKLFVPASNTKLFTALYALKNLGTDYCFTTSFLAEEPIIDGQLAGDLYFKPTADPSLTSLDLESLVQNLYASGLKNVAGNLCVLDAEFDHECFAPGSAIDDLGSWYCQPVNGLIVDHKASTINPMNQVSFTDNKKLETIFFDLGAALRLLLKKYSIQFSGDIHFVRDLPPSTCVLAEHTSEKLLILVTHMLKQSDNLYADCLFKKVAAYLQQEFATWGNSRDCLYEFLENELDLKLKDIKIVDGSGLSRYNLISPHHIVSLLLWAYDQPFFQDFLQALPIAGVDGTLKNRMLALQSKVKAKTGTLGGVSALSGYIDTDDDVLVFSVLINGYIATAECNPRIGIEEAICVLLLS